MQSLLLLASSLLLVGVSWATAASGPATFGVGKSQFQISIATETELLSYNTTSGNAFVSFFWITGDALPSGASGVDVAIWRFYVDGEATASVTLATAQAALVGNADASAPWSNELSGKLSKFGGWHVNLPIPFATSMRVTLQLPSWWSQPTLRIFAMCRGVDGRSASVGSFGALPPGARLMASVVNSTLAPLDFHTLIDIPTGAGLMLASMIDLRLYGPGAGSLNSLEGCWHAHTPPSTPFPGSFLLGTGAEDYPESAYYFNSGPYRSATSGLTVMNPSDTLSLVSFFKIHSHDLFVFNDGFKFVWRNGDIQGADGQKCTALTGTTIGTPSRANVSTLVYAYTWP